VWRDHHVLPAEQRVTDRERLGFGDVEAGAGDLPRVEGGDQRPLVDESTAGTVHEKDAVLHRLDRVGVHEVVGLGHGRRVQRHHVGPGPDLVEGHKVDAVHRGVRHRRVGSDHVHTEGACGDCDADADPSQAHQSERRSVQFQCGRGRNTGDSAIRAARHTAQALRGRQQQRHCMLGRGHGRCVRRVAHRDPRRASRVEVDIVVADPHP